MNLLIEQRPRSNLHQQSSITSRHDMNNSSSSSLVLKLKRHQQSELHSPEMANEDNSQSLSTTTNPRLKRLITNPATATRRPSSPAFNGKQQVNKRSVTIDNNNNDLTGNTEDKSCSKRFKSDELHPISSNKVDASVETVSIGLATEPDQLGPCEPGTSVVLEGIVWNETDSGVLVVNVTWRGKTYVGTLLDSTKQDWACPRLICESPTSDHDARQSNKSSRTKRGNTNRLSNPSFISSFASSLTCPLPVSTGVEDRKLRHNIKSRQSKRTNPTVNDEISTNQSSQLPSPSRPTCLPAEAKLIPCSESQCYKQFTSPMALHFHMSDAHRQSEEIASIPPQPPSTRDEEDVAHILVNVAEYVRRASPPLLPKRSSPEHQQRSTALSWPCPQISSKLVLSSSLNNNEQTLVSPLANTSRPIINNADTNLIDNSIKTEDVKSADHFLLHIHDPPPISSPPLLPNTYPNITSWMNTKTDPINPKKSSTKIPSPSLPLPASSFVPIHPVTTIPMPPTSSSPAYSDISDEDSPSRNENDQIPPPPSTINLLTAPHEKFDEHEQTFIPATRWTTQMLLQQYGSYMQQQQPFVGTHTKETTSNRLNSKPTHSLCSNGTSDSTVKNILDARRLSTTKPSSPSSLTSGSNVYHYHTTSLTSDSLLNNTLTSPNENLLKPSSAGNPLDYSLNPSSCSSSLHSSR